MTTATMRATGVGRVLVLGSDARSFLAVIRSLGRHGVATHSICSDPRCPALRSSYLVENHILPDYDTHSSSWLAALDDLLRRKCFDLVIPCDDPYIIRLAAYQASGGVAAPLELLPQPLRSLTTSKQQCHDLAMGLGAPVAKGQFVNSPAQLESAIALMSPPYVLKPISSFTESDTTTRRNVSKAFTAEDARRIGTAMLNVSPLQIQENFIGVGCGLEFLASHGTILTAFQHLRLHEPLHGGGSSYRTGVPIDPRMYSVVASIVRQLSYDGVAMVEFKYNQSTGEFIFVEMNARFWGSLPLAIASGADFPWFLFRYRKFGDLNFKKDFRLGICSRNWTLDLDWLKDNALNIRDNPILATKPWPTVAREILNVLAGRERIDTFTIDDPRPFLTELRNLIILKGGALRRRLSHRIRDLAFIRRRHRRRLLRLLGKASLIEFVCLGNICRSPFAENLARQLGAPGAPKAEVSSCGLQDTNGRVSPSTAVSEARKFGVDLSRHRSRQIDADRVKHADVILVFDWNNYETLLRRFPEARPKVFMFGELDTEMPLSVMDPWGATPEAFELVYRRITTALQCIFVPAPMNATDPGTHERPPR